MVKITITPAEQKLLDVIAKYPGRLLWYEVGEVAYPERMVQRINISGVPFRELNESTAALVHQKITSLKNKGLVETDDNHRFTVA